ncbi:MAG: alanine:cation symporter family protein [Sandaracinaceae bacterium]|nr:alanine:cation symporter family protein [Sandaracinaceae bacterium]
MDPTELTRDLEILWAWIAAPLALAAALVATVLLRAPQITKIVEAFRALKAHDPDAPGRLHPATSAALASAASFGAAGAVGAATAVSLGGAGAIAWVWLFALLLAPLRMAEALLARTAPPGQAGKPQGSLAGRLLAEKGALSVLGWALLVLVPLAGLAFYGGTHGEAVVDAAGELLPGSALALGLTVAGAAAVLALLPPERAGSILGWIGAVALVVLFGAALTAFLAEPGRAFGGFGRALLDAIHDAPSVRAFSGATAGEIAFAATLYLLPPAAATGGADGALQAEARAATKRQAAVALLAPLAFGLLTTLLGLSFVSTGAFAREVEDTRPLAELTAYRVGFDTVSQRNEEDRLFTGILRVVDGSSGVVEVELGTERGWCARRPSRTAASPRTS